MTQGHNTARRSAYETKCTSVISAEAGKTVLQYTKWETTTALRHQRRACVGVRVRLCVRACTRARACMCVCLCVRVAESAVRGRAGVYRGGGGVAQAGSIGVGVSAGAPGRGLYCFLY